MTNLHTLKKFTFRYEKFSNWPQTFSKILYQRLR